MFSFFKAVFNHFLESDTFQKGAALAYYAVFSLLPIIIIITSCLGIFFGQQAVSGEIYSELKSVLGNDAAMQIQEIVKNQHTNHNGVLTSIIGFVTLVLSASGMFSQVHDAFNSIWNIKAKPKSSILAYLSKHFLSFLILIGLFFLILMSTAINGFLLKYAPGLQADYAMAYIYEHLVSFLVFCLVFTILFKFLGDAIVHWKAAFLSGIFTSVLFMFGKFGIGMYIGQSHISSTFGSASVLALLMIWVYYTSQIIFLGASFVKIISSKLGHDILPNTDAVKIESVEVPH